MTAKLHRDWVWIMVCAGALAMDLAVLACMAHAAACAAPGILGGPTTDTTTVLCDDGSRCPNGYECPAAPGGRCEASGGIVEQWGSRAVDAGR